MQPTPSIIPHKTKKLSRATLAAQQYNFSHRWLFKVMPELNEEAWAEMILNYGMQFAERFAKIFGTNESKIFAFLTQSTPIGDNTQNLFWDWFKHRWIMDDHQYITNKVYRQPLSYAAYKTYLLQAPILENELVIILHENLNF